MRRAKTTRRSRDAELRRGPKFFPGGMSIALEMGMNASSAVSFAALIISLTPTFSIANAADSPGAKFDDRKCLASRDQVEVSCNPDRYRIASVGSRIQEAEKGGILISSEERANIYRSYSRDVRQKTSDCGVSLTNCDSRCDGAKPGTPSDVAQRFCETGPFRSRYEHYREESEIASKNADNMGALACRAASRRAGASDFCAASNSEPAPSGLSVSIGGRPPDSAAINRAMAPAPEWIIQA